MFKFLLTIQLCMLSVFTFSYSEKIISLKSVETPKAWNCSNSALWQNPEADRPKIKITASKKGTTFDYNGHTVWNAAGYKYAEAVSSESLPIKTGTSGEIRVVLKVAVEKLEFDAVVMPMFIFLDANNKVIERRDFYPFDYQQYCNTITAPGHPRTLSRTLKPPQNAVYLKLGIQQNGNASKVTLISATLESAPDKRLAKGSKKGHIPVVQYVHDNAQPTPDIAKLTDAQVTELLKKRPVAKPSLVKRGDRMVFSINGKEMPFVISFSPGSGLDAAYLQNMGKAGFKIHTIKVKTGSYGDSPGAPCNIWLGPGKYNFAPLGAEIRKFLTRIPNGYIVLDLTVNVPTAWGKAFPEDIHTNPKGEKGVATWCRVTRYGGPEPTGNEFYEANNHSERFREDGRAMLKALGAYLNSVPEGKVVIGAYLNGSADGQWLFSYEPEFADYSVSSLKHFRKYLKEKYKTEAALSQAWGNKVTFDTVQFPTFVSRQRMYGDRSRPRFPLMDYNCKNAHSADFNEFLSVSNNRRQIAFSEGLKAGSNGRLLTGCYWPTLPAAYPLSHNNHIEMLQSPAIDFISRGGILGAILHHKIPVAELDLRNLMSGTDLWLDYDHPFHAKSQAEFKRQTFGEVATQLSVGAGFHIWDMWGGWLWHPTTMEIITEAMKLCDAVHDVPPLKENYVGVFIDDKAPNHLMNLGQYWNAASVDRTVRTMGYNGAAVWGKTGLPVRFFTIEDALNPELCVPRVAIFLNPLTMSLEDAKKIRNRFEKGGRTIVYMTAPGLAAPGDVNNPSKITGFKLFNSLDTANRGIQILPIKDPLLKGLRPGMVLGYYTVDMLMEWSTSFAARPNSPGKVLARYPGTKLAGMLVSRSKAATRIWIGAPSAISPQLVRNMAREAGLMPFCENNARLIWGAGLLGVIGRPCGGQQTLRIPEGFKVTGSITGHKYEIRNKKLYFKVKPADVFGDVAIFSVEGK